MASQDSDGQEFCNNATRVCSARDSEGHGTHTLVDRRGRPRRQRGALRRRAWPRERHRPRRARDHVPRLPRQGLLQLGLGSRGPAGDPRRRQRAQLLDLGRRAAVLGSGRARVPRRHQRGDLGQRVGRQQRPRRVDLRSRRPVDDDGGRFDRPALVHLDAAPDRRRRRDAGRSGRHAHQRHLVGDPRRHGRHAGQGRRRQRGRALPVGPRRRARRPARSWSASAGRTAVSTRAAGSSRAARPG